MPEVAVVGVAGLVLVGEDLEWNAAPGTACLEVAAGQFFGGSPVAALSDGATGRGGGDVGVDADGAQLVGLAQALVAAAGRQPRVNVGVQCSYGFGVQVLVVDQQCVVVRVPAVLVAPGDLQGDDVPGNAEAALEPLPGCALRHSLPRRPLGLDETRQRVTQVVRDCDRDQAGSAAPGSPAFECFAEFGGTSPQLRCRSGVSGSPAASARRFIRAPRRHPAGSSQATRGWFETLRLYRDSAFAGAAGEAGEREGDDRRPTALRARPPRGEPRPRARSLRELSVGRVVVVMSASQTSWTPRPAHGRVSLAV